MYVSTIQVYDKKSALQRAFLCMYYHQGLNTYTVHVTKMFMFYFDQKPFSSAPEKVLLALALYFFYYGYFGYRTIDFYDNFCYILIIFKKMQHVKPFCTREIQFWNSIKHIQ